MYILYGCTSCSNNSYAIRHTGACRILSINSLLTHAKLEQGFWEKMVVVQVALLLRLGPHPLIVTTRDKGICMRVLIYSWYTTISGWWPNPIYYLFFRTPPRPQVWRWPRQSSALPVHARWITTLRPPYITPENIHNRKNMDHCVKKW